jgi:diguanylate cyclase (GGDEF)-like protein
MNTLPQPMENGRNINGLRSIRNRILIFSILVTLVPSIGMGWFWYDMTHRATTEKIEQKFVDLAAIVEREISLWLKECRYDLRVFANSFIVLDNLQAYYVDSGKTDPAGEKREDPHLQNIVTYLTLIKGQFPAYRRLVVLDRDGRMLAASDSQDSDRSIVLPDDWQGQVDRSHYVSGEVVFAGDDAIPLLPVGIPLYAPDKSVHLGFLVVEVELGNLQPLLRAAVPLTSGVQGIVALLTMDGRTVQAAASPEGGAGQSITLSQVAKLAETPRRLGRIVNGDQVRLVGLVSRFSELPWQLVIAENADDVFAGLLQARNRIILITVLLTIAIGGTAMIMAGQIIIPLESLTDGVLRVADGDLDVAVPVHRKDELGLVSGMFNEMVGRLKDNQAKLEQLATTDPLTGLANRKQIMADLAFHREYHRRYGTDFSILMMDIDYFKQVNDSYGHLAGDAVLVQLAQIFRDTLRILDCAGRYGGEEFLVILGKTESHQAVQVAERLRLSVAQHVFVHENLSLRATISVGVTGMRAEDGSTDLIDRADKALYEAKTGGRNRVVLG